VEQAQSMQEESIDPIFNLKTGQKMDYIEEMDSQDKLSNDMSIQMNLKGHTKKPTTQMVTAHGTLAVTRPLN
jgi:hypothetical protein